ncbi:MAG TPA: hypothetical protein VIF38_13565 [Burkholderiales bacterium]|jgi:hypothetical protein
MMNAVELIRNANSAPEVLSALSVYVESLRHVPVIPHECLRLPLEGEADVSQRMMALVAVVNLTSQNLRDQDCNVAKRALQVFAAATWRLRSRGKQDSIPS